MKKRKFCVLLILVLAIGITALFNFKNKETFVYADDGFTQISSLSQITDLTGNYSLQKDTVYEYSTSLGAFSGKLNGNGATVKLTGNTLLPLFSSLQTGAHVYNVCFVFENTNISVDVTSSTSFGVLANTMTGATVYGIKFSNLNIQLNDNVNNTAVSQLNVGFVAGQANNCKINQIKIENCNLTSTDDGLRPNFNIGFIVGKAEGGCQICNNLIVGNKTRITVAQSESKNFSLGGVVGLFDSGFVTNNIVDFSLSDEDFPVVVEFDRTNAYLNYGYVIGKTSSNLVSIYNNIVIVAQDKMFDLVDDNVFVGSIVGFMQTALDADDLCGYLTTLNKNFVGNLAQATVVEKFDNLTIVDTANVINSSIENVNLWQNIYSWDFVNVWHNVNSYIPALQIFDSYSVTFSSLNSVKSLSIENLPTCTDGSDVIIFNGDSNDVQYGQNLTFTASVTTKHNFNKYFEITGLLLNGTKIFDINSGICAEGYSVKLGDTITNGTTFTVENFRAGNAGIYSVELTRKEYKLKIKVYELTVNEQKFTPGKIKNNMASQANEEIVVDMKYGVRYTYETYDVNSDYSKDADWFLGYATNSQDDVDEFDIDTAKTSFSARRTMSWTFDENCVLWGSGNEEDENNYLSLSEYSYSEDDENSKMFAIYVVFTRDVKDVQIVFKFDNDKQITDKIAEVVIDDGAVSVTYKDGAFYAKIRYGTKPHTITLKQLSTDYAFDGWYLNSRLAGVEEDSYAGTFDVLNDGDANTIVLTAVFKESSNERAGSLLWLWILLGTLGAVGITALIVIIVKKKKSSSSGYKKYMY